MEQEKDNFWLYVGGGIVLIVVLVFAFKSMHSKEIPASAYSETAKQVEAQVAKSKAQK
ncbi:hypothetical protein [Candidatus Methylocalor cossyra]|uniref:Uncharacterized protein n=1 Tax=Candidatus Methylocalor cossyra TaxID=3108543 RepID=A0ABM9NIJ8_9GAMM